MKIVELHKLLRAVKGHTLHVMPGKEKLKYLILIPNRPTQYITHRIMVHLLRTFRQMIIWFTECLFQK